MNLSLSVEDTVAPRWTGIPAEVNNAARFIWFTSKLPRRGAEAATERRSLTNCVTRKRCKHHAAWCDAMRAAWHRADGRVSEGV